MESELDMFNANILHNNAPIWESERLNESPTIGFIIVIRSLLSCLPLLKTTSKKEEIVFVNPFQNFTSGKEKKMFFCILEIQTLPYLMLMSSKSLVQIY